VGVKKLGTDTCQTPKRIAKVEAAKAEPNYFSVLSPDPPIPVPILTDLNSTFQLLQGQMNIANLHSADPVLKRALYLYGCEESMCAPHGVSRS